ncbi:MAG: cysteine peptidase family C39 domain-containing protein [Acidobacteriota bacterium]
MKIETRVVSGAKASATSVDASGRTDDPPRFCDAPTATAALRSVLAGYSIKFDPSKLTEQCKVDQTGASIDDIEAVANCYGLVAEQCFFPDPDLCANDEIPLPAIFITVSNREQRDFVSVWRRAGLQFQIMDPLAGVSWVDCSELQRRIYRHEMEISGETYRGLVAVVIRGQGGLLSRLSARARLRFSNLFRFRLRRH